MLRVPDQKRDAENADFRHEVGHRCAGDEGNVDGAELHRLHHLDLATQRGVGILVDSVAPLRPLLDFRGEHVGAGAKL